MRGGGGVNKADELVVRQRSALMRELKLSKAHHKMEIDSKAVFSVVMRLETKQDFLR